MGMPISVLARGPAASGQAAAGAVDAVFAELVAVDMLFSPYREGSAVSSLGRGDTQLADWPPEVAEVAARCERARASTGGLFDPHRPDGSWDPSGLVKGWAVERASRHLQPGDVDWCLNAGGDVVVRTSGGEPFMVGIQDPRDPARVAAAVPLRSGGVATSGTAARGSHVYDPRTGHAVANGWLSVSVVGPSLETADVLATAAFVATDGWSAVVGAAPGYEALAISATGAMFRTPGWPTLD